VLLCNYLIEKFTVRSSETRSKKADRVIPAASVEGTAGLECLTIWERRVGFSVTRILSGGVY